MKPFFEIIRFHGPASVLSFIFLISCQTNRSAKPFQKTEFLMDTVVKVSLYDSINPKLLQAAMDSAFESMRHLENLVSAYVDSSDLARIRRSSVGVHVPVSDETRTILKRALDISEKTGGVFDPTLGGLMEAWGFGTKQYRIPESSELRAILAASGFRRVHVDGNNVIRDDTCRIDLGGIAKGYALDEAVTVLKRQGIHSGLLTAGGQVIMFGHPTGRKAWRIAVRHPRADSLIAVIETGETSVSTSGDYERFFMKDGKRFHHIMDPSTGNPADNGTVSVTIVAADGMTADAYSTAVFVLGPERGMKLIEDDPAIEGLILYDDQGVLKHLVSTGLRGSIRFLNEGAS